MIPWHSILAFFSGVFAAAASMCSKFAFSSFMEDIICKRMQEDQWMVDLLFFGDVECQTVSYYFRDFYRVMCSEFFFQMRVKECLFLFCSPTQLFDVPLDPPLLIDSSSKLTWNLNGIYQHSISKHSLKLNFCQIYSPI